jgi:hypothetical protein
MAMVSRDLRRRQGQGPPGVGFAAGLDPTCFAPGAVGFACGDSMLSLGSRLHGSDRYPAISTGLRNRAGRTPTESQRSRIQAAEVSEGPEGWRLFRVRHSNGRERLAIGVAVLVPPPVRVELLHNRIRGVRNRKVHHRQTRRAGDEKISFAVGDGLKLRPPVDVGTAENDCPRRLPRHAAPQIAVEGIDV